MLRMRDGGRIVFWLFDREDLASMKILSLDDEATPDAAALIMRGRDVEALRSMFET